MEGLCLCHHVAVFLNHPTPEGILRMEYFTCWTATSASKPDPNGSRAVRTILTSSLPVKRESMTKSWKVRPLSSVIVLQFCLSTDQARKLIAMPGLQRDPRLRESSLLSCSTDLSSREQETLQSVHVINVDIQDNHEEATLGAFLICELCQCVSVYLFKSPVFMQPAWDMSACLNINVILWGWCHCVM